MPVIRPPTRPGDITDEEFQFMVKAQSQRARTAFIPEGRKVAPKTLPRPTGPTSPGGRGPLTRPNIGTGAHRPGDTPFLDQASEAKRWAFTQKPSIKAGMPAPTSTPGAPSMGAPMANATATPQPPEPTRPPQDQGVPAATAGQAAPSNVQDVSQQALVETLNDAMWMGAGAVVVGLRNAFDLSYQVAIDYPIQVLNMAGRAVEAAVYAVGLILPADEDFQEMFPPGSTGFGGSSAFIGLELAGYKRPEPDHEVAMAKLLAAQQRLDRVEAFVTRDDGTIDWERVIGKVFIPEGTNTVEKLAAERGIAGLGWTFLFHPEREEQFINDVEGYWAAGVDFPSVSSDSPPITPDPVWVAPLTLSQAVLKNEDPVAEFVLGTLTDPMWLVPTSWVEMIFPAGVGITKGVRGLLHLPRNVLAGAANAARAARAAGAANEADDAARAAKLLTGGPQEPGWTVMPEVPTTAVKPVPGAGTTVRPPKTGTAATAIIENQSGAQPWFKGNLAKWLWAQSARSQSIRFADEASDAFSNLAARYAATDKDPQAYFQQLLLEASTADRSNSLARLGPREQATLIEIAERFKAKGGLSIEDILATELKSYFRGKDAKAAAALVVESVKDPQRLGIYLAQAASTQFNRELGFSPEPRGALNQTFEYITSLLKELWLGPNPAYHFTNLGDNVIKTVVSGYAANPFDWPTDHKVLEQLGDYEVTLPNTVKRGFILDTLGLSEEYPSRTAQIPIPGIGSPAGIADSLQRLTGKPFKLWAENKLLTGKGATSKILRNLNLAALMRTGRGFGNWIESTARTNIFLQAFNVKLEGEFRPSVVAFAAGLDGLPSDLMSALGNPGLIKSAKDLKRWETTYSGQSVPVSNIAAYDYQSTEPVAEALLNEIAQGLEIIQWRYKDDADNPTFQQEVDKVFDTALKAAERLHEDYTAANIASTRGPEEKLTEAVAPGAQTVIDSWLAQGKVDEVFDKADITIRANDERIEIQSGDMISDANGSRLQQLGKRLVELSAPEELPVMLDTPAGPQNLTLGQLANEGLGPLGRPPVPGANAGLVSPKERAANMAELAGGRILPVSFTQPYLIKQLTQYLAGGAASNAIIGNFVDQLSTQEGADPREIAMSLLDMVDQGKIAEVTDMLASKYGEDFGIPRSVAQRIVGDTQFSKADKLRDQMMVAAKTAWNLSDDELAVYSAVVDEMATFWARESGKPITDWYEQHGIITSNKGLVDFYQTSGKDSRAAVYYSKLENVLTGLQIQRFSGAQLKAALIKGGVKLEELKWSGVGEYLDRAIGTLRKQDVLEAVQDRMIEVVDDVRRDYSNDEHMAMLREESEHQEIYMYETPGDNIGTLPDGRQIPKGSLAARLRMPEEAMTRNAEVVAYGLLQGDGTYKLEVWTGNQLNEPTGGQQPIITDEPQLRGAIRAWLRDIIGAAPQASTLEGQSLTLLPYNNDAPDIPYGDRLPEGSTYVRFNLSATDPNENAIAYVQPERDGAFKLEIWLNGQVVVHEQTIQGLAQAPTVIRHWLVGYLEEAQQMAGVGGHTEFGDYWLSGYGTGYKEALINIKSPNNTPRELADPDDESFKLKAQSDPTAVQPYHQRPFMEPHFNTTNTVAHYRSDMRQTVNGEKALFLGEVQSAWHEAGQNPDRGYITAEKTAEHEKLLGELDAETRNAEIALEKYNDATYIDQWGRVRGSDFEGRTLADEVMELVKMYVAGYSVVPPNYSFESSLQRLRYNLGYDTFSGPSSSNRTSKLETIEAILGNNKLLDEGRQLAELYMKGTTLRFRMDHKVPEGPWMKSWSDLVLRRALRDAAEQGAEWLVLPNLEMIKEIQEWESEYADKMGPGINKFYNTKLVNYLNDYGKRWGAKVEETTLSVTGSAKGIWIEVARLNNSPAYSYQTHNVVELGGVTFDSRIEPEGGYVAFVSASDGHKEVGAFETAEEAKQALVEAVEARNGLVKGLRIPPQMAKDLMAEGVQLFQKGKGGEKLGGTQLMPDGKAIQRALSKNADVWTGLEELLHATVDALPDWAKWEFEKRAGLAKGEWQALRQSLRSAGLDKAQMKKLTTVEELYTAGGGDFFKNGEAPTSKLKEFWGRLKAMLGRVIDRIKQLFGTDKLPKEVYEAYASLFRKAGPDVGATGAQAPPNYDVARYKPQRAVVFDPATGRLASGETHIAAAAAVGQDLFGDVQLIYLTRYDDHTFISGQAGNNYALDLLEPKELQALAQALIQGGESPDSRITSSIREFNPGGFGTAMGDTNPDDYGGEVLDSDPTLGELAKGLSVGAKAPATQALEKGMRGLWSPKTGWVFGSGDVNHVATAKRLGLDLSDYLVQSEGMGNSITIPEMEEVDPAEVLRAIKELNLPDSTPTLSARPGQVYQQPGTLGELIKYYGTDLPNAARDLSLRDKPAQPAQALTATGMMLSDPEYQFVGSIDKLSPRKVPFPGDITPEYMKIHDLGEGDRFILINKAKGDTTIVVRNYAGQPVGGDDIQMVIKSLGDVGLPGETPIQINGTSGALSDWQSGKLSSDFAGNVGTAPVPLSVRKNGTEVYKDGVFISPATGRDPAFNKAYRDGMRGQGPKPIMAVLFDGRVVWSTSTSFHNQMLKTAGYDYNTSDLQAVLNDDNSWAAGGTEEAMNKLARWLKDNNADDSFTLTFIDLSVVPPSRYKGTLGDWMSKRLGDSKQAIWEDSNIAQRATAQAKADSEYMKSKAEMNAWREQAREKIRRGAGYRKQSEEQKKAFKEAFKEVYKRWVKSIEDAAFYAAQEVNRILFDYASKRNWEELLRYYSPFTTWQLRNPLFWAQAFVQRPGLLSAWYRYKQAAEATNYQRNLTGRFDDTTPLPGQDVLQHLGFLRPGYYAWNPSQTYGPGAQFRQPFEPIGQSQPQNAFEQFAQGMVRGESLTGIRPWPWISKAQEAVGLREPGLEGDMFGPLQQLPGLGEALDKLQAAVGMAPGEANRDLLDYNTNRRLAEMAAEGEITAEEAQLAQYDPESPLYQQAQQFVQSQTDRLRAYRTVVPFSLKYASPGEQRIRQTAALPNEQTRSGEFDQNSVYPYMSTYYRLFDPEQERKRSDAVLKINQKYDPQLKGLTPFDDEYGDLQGKRAGEIAAVLANGEPGQRDTTTFAAPGTGERGRVLKHLEDQEPKPSEFADGDGQIDWDSYSSAYQEFLTSVPELSKQWGYPVSADLYDRYRNRYRTPAELAKILNDRRLQPGYDLAAALQDPTSEEFKAALYEATKKHIEEDIAAGMSPEDASKRAAEFVQDARKNGLPFEIRDQIVQGSGDYGPVPATNFLGGIGEYRPELTEDYGTRQKYMQGNGDRSSGGPLDMMAPGMYDTTKTPDELLQQSVVNYYYTLLPDARRELRNRLHLKDGVDFTDHIKRLSSGELRLAADNIGQIAPTVSRPPQHQSVDALRGRGPMARPIGSGVDVNKYADAKPTQEVVEVYKQLDRDFWKYDQQKEAFDSGSGSRPEWTPLMEKYYGTLNSASANFWEHYNQSVYNQEVFDDPILAAILSTDARSLLQYTESQYRAALKYLKAHEQSLINPELTEARQSHPDWWDKAQEERALYSESRDPILEKVMTKYFGLDYGEQELWRKQNSDKWKQLVEYINTRRQAAHGLPYYGYFYRNDDYKEWYGNNDPTQGEVNGPVADPDKFTGPQQSGGRGGDSSVPGFFTKTQREAVAAHPDWWTQAQQQKTQYDAAASPELSALSSAYYDMSAADRTVWRREHVDEWARLKAYFDARRALRQSLPYYAYFYNDNDYTYWWGQTPPDQVGGTTPGSNPTPEPTSALPPQPTTESPVVPPGATPPALPTPPGPIGFQPQRTGFLPKGLR